MKLLAAADRERALGCSSQEEQVLKRLRARARPRPVELLLARGACIETGEGVYDSDFAVLLLARGACIETRSFISPAPPDARLLLARGACIETGDSLHDVPTFQVAPRKRSMY